MRAYVLLAALLFCLAQRGDSADKRVEFLRTPHFLTDDTPVAFQLRILPNEANRRFDVSAIDEVGTIIRSSGEDLPGPTTRLIEWESLGAGEYALIAQVYGVSDRVLARDDAHLTVLEFRGP